MEHIVRGEWDSTNWANIKCVVVQDWTPAVRGTPAEKGPIPAPAWHGRKRTWLGSRVVRIHRLPFIGPMRGEHMVQT